VTVFRSTSGDIAAARSMSMEELERVIVSGVNYPGQKRQLSWPV
jgi:hypothetical protein